jgi:ATP-dependent RNA helicase DDX54/DBP10
MAAYLLPVLANLLGHLRLRDPSVVALVRIRELSLQIQTEKNKFTDHSYSKSSGFFEVGDQLRRLRCVRDILIATPGRLSYILQHSQLSLSKVRYLILDEAD